ncbi:MAG TPA: hypothetical protein VMM35_01625 [Longimicrobiales bacterium]|nr:hypothetical protein [Longimicrobiales bacterium]
MAAKTSQLQIRVTEEQKAALKRLAAAAKMSVSAYVLGQALPSRQQQLERVLAGLSAPGADAEAAFRELADLLADVGTDDFRDVLGNPPLERLGPVVQNQLAALVEQAANGRGIDPPDWAQGVPPLGKPHFGWPLSSLRPHQIRVTPVAFKRRGIFFDPTSRPALSSSRSRAASASPDASEALRRLEVLDEALRRDELKVEFYFLGGAVLHQVFQARPPTARIDALFRPTSAVLDVQATVAGREGWPPGWVQQAVREQLAHGTSSRWLELGNLAAFVPPLDYVLALAVARLRLGTGGGAVEDLRYVLRALNLTTADEALEVTGRYFTPRQLPPDARATLESLLAA